jgi:hypothetical protein
MIKGNIMRTDEDSTKTYVKTLNQQADTKLAVHENRLDRIESDLTEMKEDIKAMRQILSQAQGGWRMLMVVGGACGSLGAAISWAASHISLKPIIVAACLVSLAGCFSSNTREQTVSVETRQGIEQGQPTNVVVKRQESTDAESKAGVDVAAVVTGAIAAMQGNLLGAIDKMKPQPVSFTPLEDKFDALTKLMTKPEDPVFPTGEVVGGGASVLLALMAYLKHKEAKAARNEADESYSVKERALAALSPEEAKKLLS